ncbi:hypothetical protein [Saccharothrix sp. NRRL B-16314]|uniref:hypothetical protein n=1 Tax=Saccharothrix sp. NRRL B-16314 TaxID=1463825 RepID=UPI000526D37F|nr:hypothetical protein [Saccharothrix sp. NRRL B-16314]
MPYLMLSPYQAVDKVVEWIGQEELLIDEVFRFSGDWDGWAHNQFARWLQHDLRAPGSEDLLDVRTEVGAIWTGEAATPVFQRQPGERVERANLVFNMTENIDEEAPALIVMQLRCEATAQQWDDFLSDLSADVSLLYRVDPALLPDPAERGRVVLALGINRVDSDHGVAPGFFAKFAGQKYIVQWWADVEVE